MKLILASDLSFLLKYGYDATGISKSKMKIGYITTASKVTRDKTFFAKVEQTIFENGYSFEKMDIEGKSKDAILNFFKNRNVIHVEGGNTFYLLKTIREGAFAEVLNELLDAGKVYIGTSAGAYIMCPTIEVANWDATGRDRFGLTDFSALNYVPFALKVHYRDEAENLIREKMKTLKYPLRILRDGQGIVVENGRYTFLGGEETILRVKGL